MAFRRNFRHNFRQNREIDLDQAADYLKDLVSKVKANPDELEALKKVFKKNVPLTLRSYVAAYLLKNAGGAIFRFSNHKDREDFRSNREERFNRSEEKSEDTAVASEPRERFTRVQIPAEEAETVFVSIGRNRRVYPRDLVGLFISVAGLEKEKIGDIRVLANYSFVQLFKDDAEKAIATLNGHIYRGRALSVSYSKQRDGEEAASDEIENTDDYENNEPVPNVSNESAPIVDSYTSTNSDTMAQQAAFAAQQAEMTDEEILAARAPRSSSSDDL
ncbi:MAG: DbpA RNA binding domain-containing protein [Treponema sp.]|nr:DbpA RNA binding domain-containing protein [Treponema sp.]